MKLLMLLPLLLITVVAQAKTECRLYSTCNIIGPVSPPFTPSFENFSRFAFQPKTESFTQLGNLDQIFPAGTLILEFLKLSQSNIPGLIVSRAVIGSDGKGPVPK